MTAADSALLASFRRAVRAKIERDLQSEEAVAEELRQCVIPALRQTVARARSQGRCGDVWLFGSFAWGKPTRNSDVDVLVEHCADVDDLAACLEAAGGTLVHVQERERAPASPVERVLAEGVAL